MNHSLELYKKYRPSKLEQVTGQTQAVRVLRSFIKNNSIPHAILFSGPPGCGKTTLAKILADRLPHADSDLTVLNSADFRGIDTIRDISFKVGYASLVKDGYRIWIVDECHQLTHAAQEAFLKLLEDTPEHVFFFLCTTLPEKMHKALRSRCTDVKVQLLGDKEIETIIKEVAEREKFKLSEEVLELLVNKSEGGARRALVLLGKILHVVGEESQLEVLREQDSEEKGRTLAKALFDFKGSWPETVKVLKRIEKEEVEDARRGVLGYASSLLLSQNTALQRKGSMVIRLFECPFYESGLPGLINAAFQVYQSRA